MDESIPTFRVSSAYIRNLFQQVLFGGIGIFVSWGLFLLISFWSQPISLDQLVRLSFGPMNPSEWQVAQREQVRFGIGLLFFIGLVPAAIISVGSGAFVRYEFHRETLRKFWWRFSWQVEWELVQSVHEQPHTNPVFHTLRIIQEGCRPIVVRGLESMPEFIELVKSRSSRHAKWTVSSSRIDLTRASTNFIIGFFLPLPIAASWWAYYIARFHWLELVWALVLLPVAYWIWFHRPVTRSSQGPRELEMALSLLMVLLSELLTFIVWFPSPDDFVATVSAWLDF